MRVCGAFLQAERAVYVREDPLVLLVPGGVGDVDFRPDRGGGSSSLSQAPRCPLVRPTVSTWLSMSVVPFPVRLLAGLVSVAGGEHPAGLGVSRTVCEQDVQEQPGLERVEETGADQPPAEQVLFGPGEAVGVR